MTDNFTGFIWDGKKERENREKHGVDFSLAAKAFKDPERGIYTDERHSEREPRFFCIGKVEGKILTVRFTYRDGKIRIIGAGFWRKGAKYYEKDDKQ